MIKVVFFGQLQDILNCAQLDFASFSEGTVSELRAALIHHYSGSSVDVKEHLAPQRGLVAVNQTMAEEDSPVTSGDEVAFFPPVTGG